MHAGRGFIGAGLVVLLVCPAFAGQAAGPNLSRQQRTALQALVTAVETRGADVVVPESDWPVHVLRASDGSHYVAFSLNGIPGAAPGRALVVYVRLASKAAQERSAIADWLAGKSAIPIRPRRGIAFGEMPTLGAAGLGQRTAGQQAQDLLLLELERQRAREKQEAQERARRAALEGKGPHAAAGARPLLQFEDFDVRAQALVDAATGPVLRRSVVAGPGDYELIVAWTDAEASPPTARVARRALSLPPASAALALSDVIVADEVGVRETPVPATEQASHPYSIGTTEIVPARDHVLTPSQRLALVVQIINARGTAAGKPDVDVAFRVFRRFGDREEHIGALAPQSYNELTLPLDFDVTKGHPIFAAVAVPLAPFKRGDYRMEISANDRVAGAAVSTSLTFTVAATPASLLSEAPPLAPPFDPAREGLPATLPVMFGAIRANEGNDRDAISAWQAAIDSGADRIVLLPVMIDAALRLKDAARATDLAGKALAANPQHPRLTRQLATALLLAARHGEAMTILDAHLARDAADLDAQWLALRVLFDGFVNGVGPGATEQGRTRLIALAARYIDANGAHAELARDWAKALR